MMAGLLLFLAALSAEASSVRVTVLHTSDGPQLLDAVWERSEGLEMPHRGDDAVEVRDDMGNTLSRHHLPNTTRRSILYLNGQGAATTPRRSISRVRLPWPDEATAVWLGSQSMTPRSGDIVLAEPIQHSGAAGERLDLLFLGDGYTAEEEAAFRDDVDVAANYILQMEPFNEYSGLFNVWRYFEPSEQSGILQFGDQPHNDSSYGCYYDCDGIDRLICCDETNITETATRVVAGYDGVMVLVNEDEYGGSGGADYSTAYVGAAGDLVAAHEMGHSLTALWDEYVYYGTYGDIEFAPNCSSDAVTPRWSHWFGHEEIDSYEGCSFENTFRPTPNHCIMRTLQDQYCPVCREWVIHYMYGTLGTGLIVSADPEPGMEIDLGRDEQQVFEIETIGPDDGLRWEWAVDGELISNDPEFILDSCAGHKGNLTLTVFDDTEWILDDPYGHTTAFATWPIKTRRCGTCGCSTPAAEQAKTATWLGGLSLLLLGLRRRRL